MPTLTRRVAPSSNTDAAIRCQTPARLSARGAELDLAIRVGTSIRSY